MANRSGGRYPRQCLLSEPPRNGFSPAANDGGVGAPTLSISAIRGGNVVTHGNIKYAEVPPARVEAFKLRKQDILVVRGNGNRQLCGRAGLVKDFPEGCFYPDLLIRLRVQSDKLIPEFAVMQWNELSTHQRLLKKAKSSNGISKINGEDVKTHKMLVPSIEAQREFLEAMKIKTSVALALQNSRDRTIALQCVLINQLMGVL